MLKYNGCKQQFFKLYLLWFCVDWSQLSDSGLQSFTQVLNANRVMELKSSEGLTGLYVQESASEWLG